MTCGQKSSTEGCWLVSGVQSKAVGLRRARRRSQRSCSRVGYSRIHQVLQLLAGLEERYFLGGHLDLFTSLGIASRARIALAGSEAAKAADLNLVARAQGPHHAVKDGFHDHFAVFACKFR